MIYLHMVQLLFLMITVYCFIGLIGEPDLKMKRNFLLGIVAIGTLIIYSIKFI